MRLFRPVIGTPLTIPTDLLHRFPELGEARFRVGGIFVHIAGGCLGIESVDGFTLGRTIWLSPSAPLDAGLLLHELRHVQQFASIPWFPLRYLWESMRRGYRGNRFEIDAAAYARRRVRESAE